MVNIPKGLDPSERNGMSGESSKRGVYVFEPMDEQNNKVGEPKFLEANDPAQADAFIHMGWRAATQAETEAYVKQTEEAREKLRKELQSEQDGNKVVLPVDPMVATREAAFADLEETDKDSKRAVSGTTAKATELKGKESK